MNWRAVAPVGVVAAAVGAVWLLAPPAPNSDVRDMSCSELDAAMALLTGPEAALADYDVERVQAINAEREQQDCDNAFLHPEGEQ